VHGASRDVAIPGERNLLGTVLAKAALIWAGLVVLAVLNGIAQDRLLAPRIGERLALPASGLLFSCVIFAVAAASVGFIDAASVGQCWLVGALWLSLTVAFELLFGHYVMGDSWRTLAAAYDVRRGNLWSLVLLATVVAPYAAAKLRGLV